MAVKGLSALVTMLALLTACDKQGVAPEAPIVADSLSRAILEPATAEERSIAYEVLSGYSLHASAKIVTPLLIDNEATLRRYLVAKGEVSPIDFSRQLLLLVAKPPTSTATTLRVKSLLFEGTTLHLRYATHVGAKQDSTLHPLLLISTSRPAGDSLPNLRVEEIVDTTSLQEVMP